MHEKRPLDLSFHFMGAQFSTHFLLVCSIYLYVTMLMTLDI